MTSFARLGLTMDGPLDMNDVLDVRDRHIEPTTPDILEQSTRIASALLLVILEHQSYPIKTTADLT